VPWSDLVAVKPPSASRVQPKEPRKWFEIRNSADPDEAEVMIFDEIGGWWGVTAEDFAAELNTITASNIKLRLSSPGGSVFEGICIGSALRHHPANVTVYIDSLAASIASVIMLAGDRIVAMPGSQIMIHAASTICYGNAADMEETAELLRKNTANIASLYRDKAGGTVEEWLDRMESETWYTAEEALAAGLVDEIYAPPKKEVQQDHALAASIPSSTWDLSMYRYAGRENAPAPVAASLTIQNNAQAPVVEPTAELVGSPDAISNMSRDDLVDLIRECVRAELTASESAAGPSGETEEVPETPTAETSPEETPPAQTTEETVDEQQAIPENAESPPVEQHVPEELPPDDGDPVTETNDEADVWNSIVGFLSAPTSPGADDVFATLKEAW
jgi:ATP-dependent protease ClpP protease subunit